MTYERSTLPEILPQITGQKLEIKHHDLVLLQKLPQILTQMEFPTQLIQRQCIRYMQRQCKCLSGICVTVLNIIVLGHYFIVSKESSSMHVCVRVRRCVCSTIIIFIINHYSTMKVKDTLQTGNTACMDSIISLSYLPGY